MGSRASRLHNIRNFFRFLNCAGETPAFPCHKIDFRGLLYVCGIGGDICGGIVDIGHYGDIQRRQVPDETVAADRWI